MTSAASKQEEDEICSGADVSLLLDDEHENGTLKPESMHLYGANTPIRTIAYTTTTWPSRRRIWLFVGLVWLALYLTNKPYHMGSDFDNRSIVGWKGVIIFALGFSATLVGYAALFAWVGGRFPFSIRLDASDGSIAVCDTAEMWRTFHTIDRRFERGQIQAISYDYRKDDTCLSDGYHTIVVEDKDGADNTTFVRQVAQEDEAQFVVQQVRSFLESTTASLSPVDV